MAAMTEVALDLSAKSCTPTASPRPPLPPLQRTSPVPSVLSDHEAGLELEARSGGRPSSVSSQSSAGSPPPPQQRQSHPLAGPLPAFPTAQLPGEGQTPSPRGGGGANPSMRPFKMYPFEPMTSMYSQLATQSVTAAAATAGLYPLGALPGAGGAVASSPALPPMSMFDSSPVTLASPISQYLQQRKRRHEGRTSTGSASSLDSPGLTPASGDLHHSDPASPPVTKMEPECEPPSAKEARLSDMQHRLEAGGDERRDESYWERRRKNNEAAKRSRDARRAKEEEIALRAAFLEQENLKLRAQVAILKNETAKLHYMLYNRL